MVKSRRTPGFVARHTPGLPHTGLSVHPRPQPRLRLSVHHTSAYYTPLVMLATGDQSRVPQGLCTRPPARGRDQVSQPSSWHHLGRVSGAPPTFQYPPYLYFRDPSSGLLGRPFPCFPDTMHHLLGLPHLSFVDTCRCAMCNVARSLASPRALDCLKSDAWYNSGAIKFAMEAGDRLPFVRLSPCVFTHTETGAPIARPFRGWKKKIDRLRQQSPTPLVYLCALHINTNHLR